MNVSRFCARDMRQAIRLVRESLGPDAVILSNRQIEEGIEIIAAIDYDESLLQATQPEPTNRQSTEDKQEEYQPASAASDSDADPLADTYNKHETATPAATPTEHISEQSIDAVRKEINELRGLLENQLAHLAWREMKHSKPIQAELLGKLKQMDLDRRLIDQLSEVAGRSEDTDHAWKQAMTELAGLLPVTEDDIIDEGGVVALVGSTGVGKTTSLAKLASRYVLRYGQRHVALVTTDCYRIGAHDQLKTFGRILGIPVQVAANAEELSSTLQGLANKRLVLVDTAGMSQRDMRLHTQLTSLIDCSVPIRTLLVLSATTQRSVLAETVSAFSSASLAGAIVTKVDETTSLGGVLSVLTEKHLPLAFMANGQRVPEDIHLARASDLVHRASELSQAREFPEESVLAEQYGEVDAAI